MTSNEFCWCLAGWMGSSCNEDYPPSHPSWAYPLLRLLCLSIFFVLSCLAARELALTSLLKCRQTKKSLYSAHAAAPPSEAHQPDTGDVLTNAPVVAIPTTGATGAIGTSVHARMVRVQQNAATSPQHERHEGPPLTCGITTAMLVPILTLIADMCWFAEMLDPYRVEGLHDRFNIQLIGSLALTSIICAAGISIRFFMVIHSRFHVATIKAIRSLDALLIMTLIAAIMRPIAAAMDPFSESLITVVSQWCWRAALALFVVGWIVGATMYNLRALNGLLPRTRDMQAYQSVRRLTNALKVGRAVCVFVAAGTVLSSAFPLKPAYLFTMQWYDRSTAIGASIVMLVSMSRGRDRHRDDIPSFLMPPLPVYAFGPPATAAAVGVANADVSSMGHDVNSAAAVALASGAGARVAPHSNPGARSPMIATVPISPEGIASCRSVSLRSELSNAPSPSASVKSGFDSTDNTLYSAVVMRNVATPTIAIEPMLSPPSGRAPRFNYHRTSVHAAAPSPSPISSPRVVTITNDNTAEVHSSMKVSVPPNASEPHVFLPPWDHTNHFGPSSIYERSTTYNNNENGALDIAVSKYDPLTSSIVDSTKHITSLVLPPLDSITTAGYPQSSPSHFGLSSASLPSNSFPGGVSLGGVDNTNNSNGHRDNCERGVIPSIPTTQSIPPCIT